MVVQAYWNGEGSSNTLALKYGLQWSVQTFIFLFLMIVYSSKRVVMTNLSVLSENESKTISGGNIFWDFGNALGQFTAAAHDDGYQKAHKYGH